MRVGSIVVPKISFGDSRGLLLIISAGIGANLYIRNDIPAASFEDWLEITRQSQRFDVIWDF